VHSDNAALMQLFAGQFLQSNLKSISLAQASNSSKLEGAKRQAKTLLLENLTVALRKQENAIEDGMTCSVTAYLWSNSGQDPSLSIFHLPNNIIQFLVRMERQYSLAWQQLVARAWELAPLKKGMSEADFVPRRNWLYEDLLGLAQSDGHRTRAFLRAYFLRYPLRTAKSGFGNPQVQYSLRNEFDLVSWQLTAEFLERILGMDKNRIQHIRQLASALATYVAQENDRKFFSQLYTAKKYPFLRQKLIKANLDWAKRGNAPFLDFERFIGVFEDGEDLARVDWELCRDLLLIGMVDDLHRSGWFGKNLSVFDEIDSANTPES
jgi:CRISPR-associated protein Cst1